MGTQKTIHKNGGTKPKKTVENITGPKRHSGLVCTRTIARSRTPAFTLTSVHICAYLFVSRHFILMVKTLILEEKKFGFKYVLKKGGPVRSPKIENSLIHTRNRSRDLLVPCNSPNHLANTAVHICQLIWYISQQMFISVNICLYTCICVRICAFTIHILY